MPRARHQEAIAPLKPAAFLMLLCLADAERHGYALKKAVLRRSGGRIDLGPASLYRTLEGLVRDGLIEESDRRPAPELDDERRRYYRITAAGTRVARSEAEHLAELVGEARTAGLLA